MQAGRLRYRAAGHGQRKRNGGGTVKLIVIESEYNSASSTLLENVENAVGKNGDGIAPIGHVVTVVAAEEVDIAISTIVTLEDGFDKDVANTAIKNVINEYFLELKKTWYPLTLQKAI